MVGDRGISGRESGRHSSDLDPQLVLEALSTVRDPELDEPVTDLGFVESVDVSGTSVRVTLLLPTYFCAPNFAFMMAAEARHAVEAVAGARDVTVVLSDHFASEEINEGVARSLDFEGTFPGQATGGLDELRALFRRKAFLARQERLCASLLGAGIRQSELASLRLGDLPRTAEAAEYLARRADLGIDGSTSAPFLVYPDGRMVPAETVGRHLRFARTVRVSIEGNASFCRGLLRTRYGTDRQEVRT